MSNIALVTGANRGLGFEIARLLGQSGLTVVVGARDHAAGREAAERLCSEGIDAETVALDVCAPHSVQAAADELDRRHGRIDVLVNNAGILPEATTVGAVEGNVDLELYKTTFETNVFGPVCVVQHFLPLLHRARSGRIVNVSSTMGSLVDQLDPSSQYHALVVPAYQGSKAALNGLTIALSKMLADTSIKVNSVCPGWLQTDLGGSENRAAAPTTARAGAEIVVATACGPDDGPSGQFVDHSGLVAW